jgi:hypothetical protein
LNELEIVHFAGRAELGDIPAGFGGKCPTNSRQIFMVCRVYF